MQIEATCQQALLCAFQDLVCLLMRGSSQLVVAQLAAISVWTQIANSKYVRAVLICLISFIKLNCRVSATSVGFRVHVELRSDSCRTNQARASSNLCCVACSFLVRIDYEMASIMIAYVLFGLFRQNRAHTEPMGFVQEKAYEGRPGQSR